MGSKKAKPSKQNTKHPIHHYKGWLKPIMIFCVGIVVGYGFAANEAKLIQMLTSITSHNEAPSEGGLSLESIKIDEPNGPDKNFADGCRNGVIPACQMWGFRKKEKNHIDEARFLFKYACDKGYDLACSNLESLK